MDGLVEKGVEREKERERGRKIFILIRFFILINIIKMVLKLLSFEFYSFLIFK